jgi:hypothetical protein
MGFDPAGADPWVEDVARRTQSVHDTLVERLSALAGAAGGDSPAAKAFNASHEQARDLFLGTMGDVLRSAAELIGRAESLGRGGDGGRLPTGPDPVLEAGDDQPDDQPSAKTPAANP